MSENRTDSPKKPPTPPPKINPTRESGNGKPVKLPTPNGVGSPSKGWDLLRDPELNKREDVVGSRSKE